MENSVYRIDNDSFDDRWGTIALNTAKGVPKCFIINTDKYDEHCKFNIIIPEGVEKLVIEKFNFNGSISLTDTIKTVELFDTEFAFRQVECNDRILVDRSRDGDEMLIIPVKSGRNFYCKNCEYYIPNFLENEEFVSSLPLESFTAENLSWSDETYLEDHDETFDNIVNIWRQSGHEVTTGESGRLLKRKAIEKLYLVLKAGELMDNLNKLLSKYSKGRAHHHDFAAIILSLQNYHLDYYVHLTSNSHSIYRSYDMAASNEPLGHAFHTFNLKEQNDVDEFLSVIKNQYYTDERGVSGIVGQNVAGYSTGYSFSNVSPNPYSNMYFLAYPVL